ncbi:MAG: glycosyltransferase family 4 protein [Treponema sp.]|nr:glycosyltransferase family 4 protein [Treponema sp.]MBR4631459.1 glycosyltransferase family 4 protein [Treponema sp.]
MKIGVDTFECEHGKSNAGSYLNNILKNIAKCKIDVPIDIELFGAESDRNDFEDFVSEVSSEKSSSSSNINISFVAVELPESPTRVRLWHSVGCNSFFQKRKYDVVVFLGISFLPIKCRLPSLLITNDILSNRISALPFYSRIKVAISLRNFSKIIVPTQFVKKDLKALRIHADRIAVVHNGLDHSVFYPRASDSDFVDIKPFAIQKPYFIYVSRISSPSKRHCELIKAFSEFKDKTKLPHRLVLAGEEGDYFGQVQKAAFDSPYASDIFLTGYYPHESYPELYAGAEACIYPSICEGGGMPVIEAMSMGIPVVCAKNGGIPEVAGENAIYFDGNSVSDMAAAMEKVSMTDEASVNARTKMVENALQWAGRFSWQKVSDDILSEIQSILSKKKKK